MIAVLRIAVAERTNLGYLTDATRARLASCGLTVAQVESFLSREGV